MRQLLPLSSFALLSAALLTAPAFAATNIGDLHCNDANGVALTLNNVVTIQGIVTANQPTGGLNRFYLQDATGGVNVFGTPQDCTVAVGDELEVTGTVAQFNGETEVASTGSAPLVINHLSSGNPVPAPLVETITDFNNTYQVDNCEPNESRLVNVGAGYIRTSTGAMPTAGATYAANTNYRLISAGADSTTNFATVRVVQSANNCNVTNSLVGVPINPGCLTSVNGVIVQFDSSTPFTTGYQLTPSGAGDVMPDCAVSTRVSSWGQLKTLYR